LYIQARGFTLIEVIIAMFILLVGMLALLNTLAVIIEKNLANILRDEAAYVAQSKMSDIKNTPFNDITTQYLSSQPPPPTVLPICGPPGSGVVVKRFFRGVETDYTVTCNVNTGIGSDQNTTSVQVIVSWTYKGVPYQHSISTVISNS